MERVGNSIRNILNLTLGFNLLFFLLIIRYTRRCISINKVYKMVLSHQKFREIVFQLLYSYDIGKNLDEEGIVTLLMQELTVTKRIVRTAQERVKEVLLHLPAIDGDITATSRSYDFARIQSVERNILRLSVFELLYEKQLPPKVVIAEAIRLSRKFASPESASFVNAILDYLYKISLGEKPSHATIAETSQQLCAIEEVTNTNVSQKLTI